MLSLWSQIRRIARDSMNEYLPIEFVRYKDLDSLKDEEIEAIVSAAG